MVLRVLHDTDDLIIAGVIRVPHPEVLPDGILHFGARPTASMYFCNATNV